MPSEDELLHALRRHWEDDEDATGSEEAGSGTGHGIYADDVVLEFPQTGERFEGSHHLREWRGSYPDELRFHVRQLTLHDGHAVAEIVVTRGDEIWMSTVRMLELDGDVIRRERIYVLNERDPAEFRGPSLAD
jgi:hypothetical protein